MSHEIRTPMNAVIGLTRLALKNEMPDKVRDYVGKIEESGEHLLGVVNDILDFSRIEAGKLRIEAVPFELQAIIDKATGVVSEKFDIKHIELICKIDRAVPKVLIGDALRIGQILLNYLGNAVKFTERGKVVLTANVLTSSATDLTLKFTVTDTGIGLTTEQIGRLFRGFEQADTYTTRRYGGSGLGLSISQKLALAMGGEVGVTSVVGQGSEFWFTARMGRASEESVVSQLRLARDARVGELETELAGIAGARVLLVEDNETNQLIATEMLKGAGLKVEVASNGRIGVDLVRERRVAGTPYDIVLMDMQMPLMDGVTATRIIRETRGSENVPIVAMTANAMPVDHARCLAAGMNDFVSKPIGVESLYATLLRWVKPRGPAFDKPDLPATTSGTASEVIGPTSQPSRQPAQTLDELHKLGIDVERVLAITGFGLETYLSLLRTFAARLPGQVAELGEALRNAQIEAARELAHAIKGAAANLGAAQLEQVMKELEFNLLTGNFSAPAASAFARALMLQDSLTASIDRIATHTKARPRILVVDDIKANRDFIAATLPEPSAHFTFASNGLEAVSLVERQRFDIIFTDVQMPGMDGIEAVKLIRMLPNGRDVPIVAITGNAFDEERERCTNAGFSDVVSKPVNRKQLMQVTAKWVPNELLR